MIAWSSSFSRRRWLSYSFKASKVFVLMSLSSMAFLFLSSSEYLIQVGRWFPGFFQDLLSPFAWFSSLFQIFYQLFFHFYFCLIICPLVIVKLIDLGLLSIHPFIQSLYLFMKVVQKFINLSIPFCFFLMSADVFCIISLTGGPSLLLTKALFRKLFCKSLPSAKLFLSLRLGAPKQQYPLGFW